ncbi:YlbF family regulator [Eubacterium oxidoreducens]|uniref:Control of competence regulator ComK, YlbF/YmcA n=1 Tax=Eubacterium oxidoreducens TaxID=1732 RepID=A0A1G6BG07_EUBOX|nr:YlbF family regulator [Eubacterium oxidoreducens]SDB19553.1 Control of competence regulator ComK, YlbF/YmcA [Eubacterium oxidoreducens]
MMQLDKQIDNLTESIKSSDIYIRYIKAKDEMKKSPDKCSIANEFRMEMFRMHNSDDSDLKQQQDLFYRKMEMLNDPVITEFLEAELVLCRLMQKINYEIVSCLDFDLQL